MLNILIVDDELPAAEALRQRVDWKKLEIEHVYMADSAAAAREVFQNESVQILLCDIEMPGESGLQLLQWVKQYHGDTVCIFLTCHADFSYAREAVHMGAFEYLLKPALMEDIEKAVARASGEYQKQQKLKKVAGQWEQNKETLEQQFWLEYLKGHLAYPLTELEAELLGRGIDIDMHCRYIPLICSVRRWHGNAQADYEAVAFAWKNLLTEIFTFNNCLPVVMSESMERKVLLIPVHEFAVTDQLLHDCCQKFLDVLQQFFVGNDEFYQGSACFYVGSGAQIAQLPGMYGQLIMLEQKNVAYDGKIFFLGRQTDVKDNDMKNVFSAWRSLMEDGQLEKLRDEAESYLQQAVSSQKMSRSFLEIFYHNFSQMVYAVLATKDILAQQLLQDIQPTPEEALRSVEQMIDYVKNVLRAADTYLNTLGQDNQIIAAVKDYIHEHIYEDLSRDSLAKIVYLNPNYLSRLFSNETGTSLIDYITSAKLVKVRQLLKDPNISITEAAGRVGYTNMPYFSRIYKKKYGTTLTDDRKKL